MVPPVNSSLKRAGFFNPSKAFCVFDKAFKAELFSVPYTEPCTLLVPDFVMMLTTEPELRPYSAEKLLVVI